MKSEKTTTNLKESDSGIIKGIFGIILLLLLILGFFIYDWKISQKATTIALVNYFIKGNMYEVDEFINSLKSQGPLELNCQELGEKVEKEIHNFKLRNEVVDLIKKNVYKHCDAINRGKIFPSIEKEYLKDSLKKILSFSLDNIKAELSNPFLRDDDCKNQTKFYGNFTCEEKIIDTHYANFKKEFIDLLYKESLQKVYSGNFMENLSGYVSIGGDDYVEDIEYEIMSIIRISFDNQIEKYVMKIMQTISLTSKELFRDRINCLLKIDKGVLVLDETLIFIIFFFTILDQWMKISNNKPLKLKKKEEWQCGKEINEQLAKINNSLGIISTEMVENRLSCKWEKLNTRNNQIKYGNNKKNKKGKSKQ